METTKRAEPSAQVAMREHGRKRARNMATQNWTAADLREINESRDPLKTTAAILKRKSDAGKRSGEAEKFQPHVQRFVDSARKKEFSREVIASFVGALDVASGKVGLPTFGGSGSDSTQRNAERPQFSDFLTVGITAVRAVNAKSVSIPMRKSGTGSALIESITGRKAKDVTVGSSAVWICGDGDESEALA